MRVTDFGHYGKPVVLFGGACSNRQAIDAFAAEIAGVPAISTGDTVAYGADPEGTAGAVRRNGWPTIAGNCERQVAESAEDCGCGFTSGSTCDRLSVGWWSYLARNVSDETRAWMAGLPDFGVFLHAGKRYAVLHGGATSINRFLWPSSDEADFAHEIEVVEALLGRVDGVVAGHSGIAFHRRIGRHQWINAGSIGLPPHDGRPQTRYAVLSDGEVTIRRLAYDHAAARAEMAAAGLVQGYEATLATGVWPSEDVLPQALRR